MTELVTTRKFVNDGADLPPENHRCPWTPDEDAELRRMHAEGFAAREIGLQLGRTAGAVHYRCVGIGLDPGVRALMTPRPVTRALEVVCRNLGVSKDEILLRNRQIPWPQYRFLVFWLARQLSAPIMHIGHYCAKLDHTAVLHGCKWVEKRRAAIPEYRALTDRLLAELKGGQP